MEIIKLTEQLFKEFAEKNPLKSYHQTINYARLMARHGYTYELIGYCDNNKEIHAASLILFKKISFLTYYGYAPKGFLIDYYNEELVRSFSNDLIIYYKNKNIAFIRINPEISIGEINYNNNFITSYNTNRSIINTLTKLNYQKINNTTSFVSILPRFNAIVKTKEYDVDKINKNHKSVIQKAIRKGLNVSIGEETDIPIIYEFFKKKKQRPLSYYEDYYHEFINNADVFKVSLNYDNYLLNVRKAYEDELINNQKLNEALTRNNNSHNLSAKMASDRNIDLYKEEIIEATKGAQNRNNVVIAGAIVIKFQNRVNVIISGYNKVYKAFAPNYLLHHEIINYYRDTYNYVELNGITGSSNDQKYKGLNEFKLGFKPRAYEFIGEFDLVIDNLSYKILNSTGMLKKEFKK